MTTTTPKTAANADKPGRSRLLINRNYSLLFVGQAISVIGDQISTYTMLMWIVLVITVGQPWAPLALSAVMVTGMLPNLFIGPIAGVFVDRWNHRHTMFYMDAIRAGLILVLLLFTNIVPLPFFANGKVPALWQFVMICIVTFGVSTCAQFFSPAYVGLVGKIVEEEKRPQAIGWNQSITAFASIIGPPLAAPLLISLGIQWALIIDFLSYIASLITLWAIHTPEPAFRATTSASVLSEMLTGVRFAFGNEAIRMLIIISAIGALGAGAVQALYIFFIQYNLHADVKLAGIIGAIIGVGTIIGALLAARVCRVLGTKRTLYLSLLLFGILILVFSRQVNFWLALPVVFLIGMVQAAMRVAVGPILLKETPQTMIGRVISVMTPIATVTSLLSTTLAGSLASVLLLSFSTSFLGMRFTAIDTIFVAVGGIFLLAALYAYSASRKLKNL